MNMEHDFYEPGRSAPSQEPLKRILEGLPITERRLDVGGVSTAVLEGGDGTPIVLLHSSGEFAALWSRVMPELMEMHQVVAPDLPGHGASTVHDGSLDAGRALSWLGELIDSTCTAPPALVGRGLGGALAARFAIEVGHRINRLVLVDAFGLAPLDPAPSFGLAMNNFITQPNEQTRDDLFAQCYADPDGLREQLGVRWQPIAAYALDLARTPTVQASAAELMHQFGLSAIPEADLDRITVPTTLIWGRNDLSVRVQVAESASARYGWPLHVIDSTGDDPPMERPEAFLVALDAALDAVAERVAAK